MTQRPARFIEALVLAFAILPVRISGAQPPAADTPSPPAILELTVAVSSEPVMLTYFNRPIVMLRADVLGRDPAERRSTAIRSLDSLIEAGRTGPVAARPVPGGVLIGIDQQIITGLAPADLDPLAGETLEGVTDETVRRLQRVLEDAIAARQPRVWMRGVFLTGAAFLAGLLLLWWLGRIRRRVLERLSALTGEVVGRTGLADQQATRASQLLIFLQRRFVAILVLALRLAVVYLMLTFTFRQFPYTQPWGDSLRGSLLDVGSQTAESIAAAIPGLITVGVIVVVTRLLTRLLEPWFEAVERGRIQIRWVYPETAATTRRLLTVILWLLAAAIAYPYVPGSGSEAFKGISVFVGLMVTLGSSGLVSQVMSGFMLTYARALRPNDFVRIGDVEGTITQLGVLSTKVKTLRSEEITIPNAVVVSQTITDYSRFADAVLTSTSVTIGYDAPWRQVHALLLLAAERTPGLRRDPSPRVLQTALEDSGVRYTLSFCLEQQQSKLTMLTALHGHIQDLFNEYGVQIMTPQYEGDPAAPKLVRKQDWFAAPARAEPRPAVRKLP